MYVFGPWAKRWLAYFFFFKSGHTPEMGREKLDRANKKALALV